MGGGGPGGGGGGYGEECNVDISGPGRFVGSFHPWSQNDQQAPVTEAQLLSHRPRAHQSAADPLPSFADLGRSSIRMNENFVFKGRFVPDSAAGPKSSSPHPSSASLSSTHSKSPPHTVSDVSAPLTAKEAPGKSDLTHHVVLLNSPQDQSAPPKMRDGEARHGAPGAAGGKRDKKEANKRLRRAQQQHASALADAGRQGRRLLTSNSSSSNATRGAADLLGAVEGTLYLDFEDSWGHCADPSSDLSDEMIFDAVKEWVRSVLNAEGALDGPEYAASHIAVSKAETGGGGKGGPPGGSIRDEPIWDPRYSCDSEYAEALLDIAVTVQQSQDRVKIVDLLLNSLFASPLQQTQGKFPGDVTYTQSWTRWNQEPTAAFCGDAITQDEKEEDCDEGSSFMSEWGACNLCRCVSGFVVDPLDEGKCICEADQPNPRIDAVETSSVQGAENNVTFAIQLTAAVTGIDSDGRITSPAVVTISGLQGASISATAGEVSIRCKHRLITSWLDSNGQPECKLGLPPVAGSSSFRAGIAKWNEAEGTLVFTVLGRLEAGAEDPRNRQFELSVTMTNSPSVQRERRPEVSVCEHRGTDATSSYANLGLYQAEQGSGALSESGYILGSTAQRLEASNEMQVVEFQKSLSGQTVTVLSVRVPGGAIPDNGELIVFGKECEVGKGMSLAMKYRIPYLENGPAEDVLAGAGNTMLKLTLRDKVSRQNLAFLRDDVEVEFGVDELVKRSRGQVCVCVCVCVCVFACMHAYVNTYVRAYVHTCMHAYIHTCMHAYTHTHTHSYHVQHIKHMHAYK